MSRRLTVFCCLVVAAMVMLSVDGSAGKFNRKLSIGDQGPGFEDVEGIDGEKHSLGDYKNAKVLVLSFTCNHCPVAVAYEDRFVEFTKTYKDKGVAFVAINVSNLPADRLDKMRERAAKKGFNFDYLYDSSQETGGAYGASVTPHLFVLDRNRKIAYMGAFDDSMNPSKVQTHYISDAVDALLAGKEPEITETRQIGCGIKYEKK